MKRFIPYILIVLVFLLIIFSRIIFIEADAPRVPGVSEFMVNIEEKASGYNARNKVFFGKWESDSDWYQPMVYMPLSNLFIFLSFLKFGVGLWQLRLPSIILSLIGILFLYKIMIKETSFLIALVTTALFSFNFNVLFWNRSSLNENLFLFFIPLALFCYIKSSEDIRYIFLFSIFSFLNLLVKIDSGPFILATIIMFTFYLCRDFSKFKKAVMLFSLGIIFVLLFWVVLMGFTGSFKYLLVVYKHLSGLYLFNQINSLSSLFLLPWENANQVIRILIFMNPYFVFLAILAFLYIIINYNTITKLQLFCLLIVGIWLLQICFFPKHRVGAFKRYIYIMWPLYCLVGVTLYRLKSNFKGKYAFSKFKLSITSIISFLLFFIILFKGYQPFKKIFLSNLGNIWIFGIFSIIFLIMLVLNNLLKKRLFKNAALTIYSILLILCINFDVSATIRYLKAPKYSYLTTSRQFAKDINIGGKVIGHEQAFRMLGLVNKVHFTFTQDGYQPHGFLQKVIDREDARYFVLMVKQHTRKTSGYDYKDGGYVREKIMQIKNKYPEVGLLRIYDPLSYDALALYDKYPERDSDLNDFDIFKNENTLFDRKPTLDEYSEVKWKYLICEKAMNPGFRYYRLILEWPQVVRAALYEDVKVIKSNLSEIILKIKVHGKLTEGMLRLIKNMPILEGEAEISLNGIDWIDVTERNVGEMGNNFYDLSIFSGAEEIFLSFRRLSDSEFIYEFELQYIAESSDQLAVKVNFFGFRQGELIISLADVKEKIEKVIITTDKRIWVGPLDGLHHEIGIAQEKDKTDLYFDPLGIDNVNDVVFKISIQYSNIYKHRQESEFYINNGELDIDLTGDGKVDQIIFFGKKKS